MLAALHDRLELSLPPGGNGCALALPWRGGKALGGGAANASQRLAELEANVAQLEVRPTCGLRHSESSASRGADAALPSGKALNSAQLR